MKRTSIMLPQYLKIQASEKAHSLGVSLGEFIRRTLLLSLRESQQHSEKDALFADNVVFSGIVPKDMSLNHDEHLYGDKAL